MRYKTGLASGNWQDGQMSAFAEGEKSKVKIYTKSSKSNRGFSTGRNSKKMTISRSSSVYSQSVRYAERWRIPRDQVRGCTCGDVRSGGGVYEPVYDVEGEE